MILKDAAYWDELTAVQFRIPSDKFAAQLAAQLDVPEKTKR